MKLAKLGYYQGSPDKVLAAPVDSVVNILHYETFESQYQETLQELNKE